MPLFRTFISVICLSVVLFLAPVSLALEGIDTIALGEEKPVESLYFMGKLYVMSQESKKVTRIDVGNNRVIDTATLGRVPVFATATNKKIYFQHTDTKAVSIFDTVENKVIKTLSTGLGPIFGIMNVGNLFVLNQVSNSMTVIDLSVDLVESNVKIDDEYGDPESLLLYGSKVYILSTKNSKISIFNKYNNVVTKAIAVPANPIKAIRVDTKVYVLHRGNGVISVIDASKEKLIDTIILSAPGDDFYLANNNLYIIQKDYNTVSVIDTSSIAIKKTVGAVIPVGESPVSASLSGDYLYVNNFKSNSVSVIDTTNNTVVRTIPVETGPVSSTVASNRIYVNSPESKTISVIHTVPPVLYGITSQAPNGVYGPGSTINVRAVFDQKLKPGSTMDITFNTGKTITLSDIDNSILQGKYIVGEGESVDDLTNTSLQAIKIIGISGLESTEYIIPSGKNLGDLKNITLTTEKKETPEPPSNSLTCQKPGTLYRQCAPVKTVSNFSEYTSSLLCENIIDESLSQRSHKRLSRYDVLAMAVHMNRTELVNSSDYRGSFEDVTRNMYAVVQTGLDIGLITDGTFFNPSKNITRLEAYTLLMRGVCLAPEPQAGKDWSRLVYDTAYQAGITKLTWEKFRPQNRSSKREVFILASRLADWADKTGGCQTLNICR